MSASASRGLLVLGWLLAVTLIAGCGGGSGRERVRDYLAEVNGVQRKSAPAFSRANRAYADFSAGKLRSGATSLAIARAERSMQSARTRLSRLDPPQEAAELHRRLLRVYDANLRLARETTELARYLPAASAALRPLRRINGQLRRELGSARGAADQGGALAHYADSLGTVLERLRHLRVPPVLASSDRDRVRRLRSTRSLAVRLRVALERRNVKGVARLLLRFRRATDPQTEREALDARSLGAYNRRYRAVGRATAAAQREHARLERSL